MSVGSERSGVPEPLGRVGRYTLRAELASGGMATVYLAELQGPHGFEKVVGVKRIHPHLVKDRHFVEMFLDEARLAARIHHPNVCAIVDFGEDRGAPYLVMEFLRGEPFSSVMRAISAEEETPFWLAARVVHDAAIGLHAAHTLRASDGELAGVVHRDVSPQNIFVLYDGLTKVVDFGVARARGRLTTTRTNEVKGKLSYMAPEQFNQETVDARTDVWALGVLLWESTVGRRLFRGDNDGATLNLVLQRPIPRPSERCEGYPAELEAIVMRCLERDPAKRYASAEELAGDLEEYIYATGRPAGPSQVKRWMEGHFAERIARQEALLRGEPGPAVDDLDAEATRSSLRSRSPAPSLDDQPTNVLRGPRAGAGAIAPPQAAPSPPRVAPRSRPLVWAGVGGALLVLGVLLGRGLGGAEPEAAPESWAATPLGGVEEGALPPEGASGSATAEVADDTSAADEGVAQAAEVEPPSSEGAPSAPDDGDRRAPSRDRRAARASSSHAAESPRAAAPGRLSLMAIPSATVRLGGRSLGTTPLVNVALPPGTHRLELRTEAGRTKSVTVRIESGALTRRRVEL